MKSWVFYTIIVGTITGMIAGMFVVPDQTLKLLGIAAATAVSWTLVFSKRLYSRNYLLITLLFLVMFGGGFWRTNQFHQIYPFDAFNRFQDENITVAGIVKDVPVMKPGTQSVRIHPELINGEKVSPKSRDVVIKMSDLETYNPGDKIVVFGSFKLRENFMSDSGREVEYRLMSYSRKIAGDIAYPTVTEHIPAEKSLRITFATIKHIFVRTLQNIFVDPAAGLLAGIMIGDTSSLTGDFLDLFRAVGLIHIVVLSGYNITLIAGIFSRMFAPLGYYRRIIAAMIALVFFIAVVGISQTAMRAGIMALAAFSARYFVRPYAVTRAILLALAIMVWISPYALLFDLSLQLSFLATFGIVYVFPILQKKYESLAEGEIGEIFLQTVAVNILTLPVIIYQMGYFSLLSFPVNVAVLGFMPILTVGGFIAVLFGMIIPTLGRLFAFPLQLLTDSIIQFVSWSAAHDPFKISLPVFSIEILLGAYMIIAYWIMNSVHLQKINSNDNK